MKAEMMRRLHMGCGESLCGLFTHREKLREVLLGNQASNLKRQVRRVQQKKKRA